MTGGDSTRSYWRVTFLIARAPGSGVSLHRRLSQKFRCNLITLESLAESCNSDEAAYYLQKARVSLIKPYCPKPARQTGTHSGVQEHMVSLASKLYVVQCSGWYRRARTVRNPSIPRYISITAAVPYTRFLVWGSGARTVNN